MKVRWFEYALFPFVLVAVLVVGAYAWLDRRMTDDGV